MRAVSISTDSHRLTDDIYIFDTDTRNLKLHWELTNILQSYDANSAFFKVRKCQIPSFHQIKA